MDRRLPLRPPTWIWGLAVVAQVAVAAIATSYTFFFVDDFLFLQQAQTQPFSVGYLREQLFEHFSPISRLLDKLLVTVSPGSFVLAHGVELALYAAALIAFAYVIRAILGNTWTALALCIIFGQSVFLMRLLSWWTATANILPSTIFTLLALGCFLRWRETRSRALLAGSFAAYALALLDYETAILFPAYLAVVRLLVMEDLSARAWLRAVRSELWAWVGYLVLAGAALANYYAYYYVPPAHRPSLGALGQYTLQALPVTFIPALMGVKYPVAPSTHTLAIAVTTAALVLAVVMTMYLRPRAWRCVVAFLIVFAVTMLPVAFARIGEFGVSIGHVIYYQQSLQLMFLVLAAFAISPRWGGRALPERGRPLEPRVRTAAIVGAVAVAAVYATLLITSLRAMSAASWQPRQDSAYVGTYLASTRRVEAATGRNPVLIDLLVPKQVLPHPLWPYTTYGMFFSLFNPAIRVDLVAEPLYTVNRGGELVRVRYVQAARGLIGRSTVSAGPPRRDGRKVSDGRGCAPTRAGNWWLRVPLAHEQLISRPSYALRVRFRGLGSGKVPIDAVFVHGAPHRLSVTRATVPSSGGEIVPLLLTGRLRDVAFRLRPGACVTTASVGRLRGA